jgi:hypothetical protein
MPPTGGFWNASSSLLAEALLTPDEPLELLVSGGVQRPIRDVCDAAARALLGLAGPAVPPPAWLLPHQIPAYARLQAIVGQFGGGVLADAVGLGKTYVSLAIARASGGAVLLVVPAVLTRQWTALAARLGITASVISHERLSRRSASVTMGDCPPGVLLIVDEAHRFRHPSARRYRALARLAIRARVLLVTATPVHNRFADLIHLLRLFLRDDALVALGLPSLTEAARAGVTPVTAQRVIARLVVARSRARAATALPGLTFPTRQATMMIRAGSTDPTRITPLIARIGQLGAGTTSAALFRLMLLHRLASSLDAFRHSLRRYEAYQAIALEAGQSRRRLRPADFQRLFPPTEAPDLQLAFLPLLLEAQSEPPATLEDTARVQALLATLGPGPDPKADALATLLAGRAVKTLVFATAAATVRHLHARLVGRHRVGAIIGERGWLGRDRAARFDVLTAFAPDALGAPPPPAAGLVDVLIATDLLSEGLNLQDAERVVHYDLPWSPARLAQRVGRIDRLGSRRHVIETVTFLPPHVLADALAIERRLADKVVAQRAAGSAHVETVGGPGNTAAPLDWCDRLQRLVVDDSPAAPLGVTAAGQGDREACVLVLRFGSLVDTLVVEGADVTDDPERATALLESAAVAASMSLDRAALKRAIRLAAPLVRQRAAEMAAARWRAAHRDGAARRLVPMGLAAARKAARAGQGARLARLDSLVSRLTRGLKAGEEVMLEELVERRSALGVRDLMRWHESLPPTGTFPEPGAPELVAAVLLGRPSGQAHEIE